MDFGTLLHMAKKNNDTLKKDSSSSYYSTKYAPPKKESKEKKLSDNIQKFLQKREQEERERKRQEKEKLNKLLAMRDEKSKNKIRKMLKVTKSANKSVLDDCGNSETAVTLQGADQPDQDDYGYVSTEANAFYQKYIEKVKDVKEDKGFAPSRPQSVTDLKGTKERVKAAITRENEDKKLPKQRSSHSGTGSTTAKINSCSNVGGGSQTSVRAYSTTKSLYDPVAERQEEERKKREEEQKRAKQRKPAPPPMDFQALLKLAEKKQFEPVELPTEVKKPKEPERLLTSKEKRELEERKRAKEARERREKEQQRSGHNGLKERERKESGPAVPCMDPNGRIPKKNVQTLPNNNFQISSSNRNAGSTPTSKSVIPPKAATQIPPNKSSKKPETHSSVHSSSGRLNSVPSKPSTSANNVISKKTSANANSSNSNSSSSTVVSKKPYEGPTREFPPRDIKSIKSRPFPPPDVRRSDPKQNYKPQTKKRRILNDDDDDEDYDSEMDDFIDDGDEEDDYSSHIKAIFGYDKSKYRDHDDFDDRAMESNFAQVQREEFISKKIGLQEDLEDMRLEAMEKKRKMSKKKKMH